MGVDRPMVRIQGVGPARARLVKKHVASLGGQLLCLGQLVWGYSGVETFAFTFG